MPPDWISSRLPPFLARHTVLDVELWQWLGLALAVAIGMVVGRLGCLLVVGLLRRLVARTKVQWDDDVLEAVKGPTRFLLAVLTFAPLVKLLDLRDGPAMVVGKAVQVALVAAIAWYLFKGVDLAGLWIERRATTRDDADELRRRGIRTQIAVMRRVAHAVMIVFTVAVVLLQFDPVRSVGVSLFASAGVAGVVIGFAAQKSFGTLLAGLQLSITQPIRIGDTVVVGGENGTVEQITLSYVIIKVWDERRLIVPVTKFLDDSFENWTRVSSQILGSVEIFADYRVRVADARAEVERFVKAHPLWDGRTVNLQVTEVTPETVKLRALVSAADAGKNWDLRVALREHMVEWIRDRDNGRFLPRRRIEEKGEAEAEAA